MSKNLCPENDISFENSQTVRFETNLPAGTYTTSAVVTSTDTDSSTCLMLFYYADNSTKEVYINRSMDGERVFKSAEFTQEVTKGRIYASEGYNLSVGDTATFSQLMIEAGSEMTDYVPYEDEPEPEPTEDKLAEFEVSLYWAVVAAAIPIVVLPDPTCRETMLISKLLDSTYEVPFTNSQSRVEGYLWDLVNGTTEILTNIPKSDKEKYLHCMIGGTVDEMPNPYACELNYWMNEALLKMQQDA